MVDDDLQVGDVEDPHPLGVHGPEVAPLVDAGEVVLGGVGLNGLSD